MVKSSENPECVWYATIWPKCKTSAAVNVWSGAGQRRLMQSSTSLTRPSGAQLEWSLTGLATAAALTPHSRQPFNSAKTVKQRRDAVTVYTHAKTQKINKKTIYICKPKKFKSESFGCKRCNLSHITSSVFDTHGKLFLVMQVSPFSLTSSNKSPSQNLCFRPVWITLTLTNALPGGK